MIQRINYSKIFDLINELTECRKRRDKATKTSPKPPLQPKIVYENSDWDDYLYMLNDYNRQCQDRDSEIEISSNTIEVIKAAIRELLPPNTWVRMSMCDGYHYVGYETDTWPMHIPKLQIIKTDDETELPTLKHRLNNGN